MNGQQQQQVARSTSSNAMEPTNETEGQSIEDSEARLLLRRVDSCSTPSSGHLVAQKNDYCGGQVGASISEHKENGSRVARVATLLIDKQATKSGQAISAGSPSQMCTINVPVVSIHSPAPPTTVPGDKKRCRLSTFTGHPMADSANTGTSHNEYDQFNSKSTSSKAQLSNSNSNSNNNNISSSSNGNDLGDKSMNSSSSVSSIASTTSDVNSNDDAASIASRLSQIVCEQEFKLVHMLAQGAPAREGAAANSADERGGGSGSGRGQDDGSKRQRKGSQKSAAKLGSSLAVRQASCHNPANDERKRASLKQIKSSVDVRVRYTDDTSAHDSSQRVAAAAAAAANESGSNENDATDGDQKRDHKEPTDQWGLAFFSNNNNNNNNTGANGASCKPERGNLRTLESSRHHAGSKSSADLHKNSPIRHRSSSFNRRQVGFREQQQQQQQQQQQPMLNICRSAWTLDEFEQTFKPTSGASSNEIGASGIAPLPDGSGAYAPDDGGGGGAGAGFDRYNDSLADSSGTDLLRRASRNATTLSQHLHQQNGLLTSGCLASGAAPTGSCALNNQVAAAAAAGMAPGALKENRFSYSQLSVNYNTSNNNNNNNNYNGSRRPSSIGGSSIASSMDSYASARPFGRLGSLLSPQKRRREQKRSRQQAGGGGGGNNNNNNMQARNSSKVRSDRGGGGGGGGGDDNDDDADDGECLSSCCSLSTLRQYLPIVEWLPDYRMNYLWGDVTAGLAVTVLNISTSLSAAVVAQTELGAAFRSSIVNTFVYALLCSSRHTSFGSWSIMSQMLLDSVTRALSDELILNRINLGPAIGWNADKYEMWHMNIIIMYTFLIGLVQLLAGLMNLGNILASFIPEALSSSMIVATAFTMAVGQLANMCGTSNKILWAIEKNTTELAWADLKNPPVDITDLFAGLFRWIQQVALLIKHRQQINLICVGISIGCVLLLTLNQTLLQGGQLQRLFKRKTSNNKNSSSSKNSTSTNLFIPFELILLVSMIVLSYWFNLKEAPYNVTTCGPIFIEFSLPNVPNLRLVRELWFDSLATALISYTMVFIMAKTYSNKLNYEVDGNQELIACGAGNLIGGLFDALPATASFSRTAGQVEAGGQTQMASLINCVALFVVARFLGHHVAQLPVCVMAATLFFGFVRMMARFKEVFLYWRLCKVDFAIWLVTFVAIITLDLVNGFVYGFIFSILTMLYRAQNRRCYMLGSIGTPDVYVPLAKYPLAREIDGMKIFQFCGPIHYVSADLFERLLRQKTRVNVKKILRQRQEQQEQRHGQGLEQQQQQQSMEEINHHQQPIKIISSQLSSAFGQAVVDSNQQQQQQQPSQLPTHIILDFSMISFIDSAGVHVIKKIIADYQRVNITVMLASLASHVATVVKSEPTLWNVHKDRFYVTLADALHHALREKNNIDSNQRQLTRLGE